MEKVEGDMPVNGVCSVGVGGGVCCRSVIVKKEHLLALQQYDEEEADGSRPSAGQSPPASCLQIHAEGYPEWVRLVLLGLVGVGGCEPKNRNLFLVSRVPQKAKKGRESVYYGNWKHAGTM